MNEIVNILAKSPRSYARVPTDIVRRLTSADAEEAVRTLLRWLPCRQPASFALTKNGFPGTRRTRPSSCSEPSAKSPATTRRWWCAISSFPRIASTTWRASGRAHIGYLLRWRVVGLSKLARVVEIFAHWLQIQERMTEQIADAIQTALEPRGVGVALEGSHACMSS